MISINTVCLISQTSLGLNHTAYLFTTFV